jgi:hypothetical protein
MSADPNQETPQACEGEERAVVAERSKQEIDGSTSPCLALLSSRAVASLLRPALPPATLPTMALG